MSSLLVFYRVYRLEILSVMLVFSTQLREFGYLPALSPPLPCVNNGSILYTIIHCSVLGGGGMGSGPQTDKHLPQSPFTGKFLDNDIWHSILSV